MGRPFAIGNGICAAWCHQGSVDIERLKTAITILPKAAIHGHLGLDLQRRVANDPLCARRYPDSFPHTNPYLHRPRDLQPGFVRAKSYRLRPDCPFVVGSAAGWATALSPETSVKARPCNRCIVNLFMQFPLRLAANKDAACRNGLRRNETKVS